MISIIIPIYNVSEYIGECLESISLQTYTDFQVIIVDDGSTDSTMDIVNKYKDKFKEILILCQENAGVSVARNTAFDYIKGKYTIYIDPDDFLELNMLENLNNKAEENNADIVICEYYVYYGEKDHKNYIERYKKNQNVIYKNFDVIDLMLNYKLQGQLWNKLFKTELLKRIDFKFEPHRYIQDAFPVFRAIYNSKRICFIERPLYYYRQRETSTVHKKNSKLAEDYYHAMTSIINYIKDENIMINMRSLNIFKVHVLSHFIAHYTNANELNDLKTFRKSKYNELNVKNRDFILLPEISKNDKVKLFLWNSGLYSILKKLKNRK